MIGELSLGNVTQLGTLLQDPELSLGNVSQLGILLQDRRAEFR